MCGIVGIVGEGDPDVVRTAIAKLRHRGPDGHGVWQSAQGLATLGHARLAVVELSDAGAQPMRSADGRYAIVFNGEIYNHLEMRQSLEAAGHQHAWRGHSDTETLLVAISAWGVRPALERSVGMFAFGLWDERERRLTLARDRLGEKPLYYWAAARQFRFASELKALLCLGSERLDVDTTALHDYLRLGYVPAPRSIWRGILKLPPGCLLHISAGQAVVPQAERYWALEDVVRTGRAQPFRGTASEAVAELSRLIDRSVQLQRVADVPVGVFLSGGIDSSVVAAAMAMRDPRSVRTFTVGSEDARFDESASARAVAEALGTTHYSERVSAAAAIGLIPGLSAVYDEPFADSSQIPTMLVSRWARQQVTVCLTGDGGDELFGGYNRHVWYSRIMRTNRVARSIAALALGMFSPDRWDQLAEASAPIMPVPLRLRSAGNKIAKLRVMLRATDSFEAYMALVSSRVPLAAFSTGVGQGIEGRLRGISQGLATSPIEWAMAADTLTFLPDDVLCKVDRAAMAASLETRAPFLDHRIAEFAWTLPVDWKVRGAQSKWILREVLESRLPRPLWDRPKTGFGLPVGQWLRGPLRDWASDLLSGSRLRGQDMVDRDIVERCWKAHLSGQDWSRELWTVLMLMDWHRRCSER